MHLNEKERALATDIAIRAAKKVAAKYERGRDAWRECVGHIVETILERARKLKSCEDYPRWLRATSLGEARKYWRIEYRQRLG